MKQHRIAFLALTLALSALMTGTAAAHIPKTITIRHQMAGCHAWSLSPGGPFNASLVVKVDRDTEFVVVNDDVMPHRLVQVHGPKALLSSVNMNRMGARGYITFTRPGIYSFRTKAGEDYAWVHGMHTRGVDNILRLRVVVT